MFAISIAKLRINIAITIFYDIIRTEDERYGDIRIIHGA